MFGAGILYCCYFCAVEVGTDKETNAICSVTVPEDTVRSWSKMSSAISKRMAELKEVVSRLESECDGANSKTIDIQRNPCIKRDHEVLISV
jgi:hypothetical protein